MVSTAIGNVAKDQDQMTVKKLAELKNTPRPQRRVIVMTGLYKKDVPNVVDLDAESIKALYSGRTIGPAGGSATAFPSPMGAGPDFRMDPTRPPTGYAMPGRPSGAAAPLRPTGRGEKRAKTVQAEPARRGFVLFLVGTTPQRGINATNFLTKLKNELTGIVKQAQAATESGSTSQLTLPVDDVVADKIVQITPGREPETPGEVTGAPRGSEMRDVIDPLTGESASGDTQFVVGWLFRLKEDKPRKGLKAQQPAARRVDLRVEGML